MAIDFIPLPMSELRTHPGEILDRVANGGESFVIEKNGRKKACLVPLSVFLPDISPARIAHELDELERGGESLRTTINSAKEIEILFKQKVDRNTYSLKIVLPHEYPNACPRVYADPIEADAPHRFSDGALCIFGVMSSWNPGKHSARTALLSGRQWLRHYEAWRNKGEWPKPEVSDVRSQ